MSLQADAYNEVHVTRRGFRQLFRGDHTKLFLIPDNGTPCVSGDILAIVHTGRLGRRIKHVRVMAVRRYRDHAELACSGEPLLDDPLRNVLIQRFLDAGDQPAHQPMLALELVPVPS